MLPPKNVSKITFFNFKIPGKIPKISLSKFENLMLKIVNLKVFYPLKIFQGKMENFKFFLVENIPTKKFFKIFFNFKISKILKINFSKFEKLMLTNNKFKGVFPLKILKGKMKIFKFFLVFKYSHQKMFRKLFFLIENSRQNSQN
jgi:hypothetical protein